MAEGVRSHEVAAGAAFSGHRPAKGASAARKLLRRGELGNRRTPKKALMRIHSAVEQHLTERSQIRRSAEYASMSRDAADRRSIFVVHFALNQPVTILIVDFGRRDRWPNLFRRVVSAVLHGQR